MILNPIPPYSKACMPEYPWSIKSAKGTLETWQDYRDPEEASYHKFFKTKEDAQETAHLQANYGSTVCNHYEEVCDAVLSPRKACDASAAAALDKYIKARIAPFEAFSALCKAARDNYSSDIDRNKIKQTANRVYLEAERGLFNVYLDELQEAADKYQRDI